MKGDASGGYQDCGKQRVDEEERPYVKSSAGGREVLQDGQHR